MTERDARPTARSSAASHAASAMRACTATSSATARSAASSAPVARCSATAPPASGRPSVRASVRPPAPSARATSSSPDPPSTGPAPRSAPSAAPDSPATATSAARGRTTAAPVAEDASRSAESSSSTPAARLGAAWNAATTWTGRAERCCSIRSLPCVRGRRRISGDARPGPSAARRDAEPRLDHSSIAPSICAQSVWDENSRGAVRERRPAPRGPTARAAARQAVTVVPRQASESPPTCHTSVTASRASSSSVQAEVSSSRRRPDPAATSPTGTSVPSTHAHAVSG